jgi:hypothetical protein
MTRTILRNLIVLTAMSFALAFGPDSLAGDYLKNVTCIGPCMRTAWDDGVAVSGTGHCYFVDEAHEEWPTSDLWESAWVYYDCNEDGLTYNEAEIVQEDDQVVEASASAFYGYYYRVFTGYSFQSCSGEPSSGEYDDERGCPWW